MGKDQAKAGGIKISDAEMKALNIRYHIFHEDWNYTISPIQPQPPWSVYFDQILGAGQQRPGRLTQAVLRRAAPAQRV